MSWPEFRPTLLLQRLVEADVRFVVIGGFAAVAHGSVQVTHDLDITYATDADNLDALGRALVAIDARLRGVAESVPFTPDAATLRRTQVLTLSTAEGPLDLIADPEGSPGYELLRQRAIEVPLHGIVVPVASLTDLVAMKRASGRPKDLLAIEELEAIERLERD